MKDRIINFLLGAFVLIGLAVALMLSGCGAVRDVGERTLSASGEAIQNIDDGVREANRQFEQAGKNKARRASDTQEGISALNESVTETTQEQADRQLANAHAIQERVGKRTENQLRFQCRDLQPGAEITIAGTSIRTRCPTPAPAPEADPAQDG